MKTIRTILSAIFLIMGATMLSMLVNTHSGGTNVIGNFLFSGYSYMAYVIPGFYFWFFAILIMKGQNPQRLIWPVLSLVPFFIFTLAVKMQIWDGTEAHAPPLAEFEELLGQGGAVAFLYIIGMLVIIGEILFFGMVYQKNAELEQATLQEERIQREMEYNAKLMRDSQDAERKRVREAAVLSQVNPETMRPIHTLAPTLVHTQNDEVIESVQTSKSNELQKSEDDINIDRADEITNEEIAEFSSLEVETVSEVNNTQVNNTQVENVQVENVQVENVQVENAQVDNAQVDNAQVDNAQVEKRQIEENYMLVFNKRKTASRRVNSDINLYNDDLLEMNRDEFENDEMIFEHAPKTQEEYWADNENSTLEIIEDDDFSGYDNNGVRVRTPILMSAENNIKEPIVASIETQTDTALQSIDVTTEKKLDIPDNGDSDEDSFEMLSDEDSFEMFSDEESFDMPSDEESPIVSDSKSTTIKKESDIEEEQWLAMHSKYAPLQDSENFEMLEENAMPQHNTYEEDDDSSRASSLEHVKEHDLKKSEMAEEKVTPLHIDEVPTVIEDAESSHYEDYAEYEGDYENGLKAYVDEYVGDTYEGESQAIVETIDFADENNVVEEDYENSPINLEVESDEEHTQNEYNTEHEIVVEEVVDDIFEEDTADEIIEPKKSKTRKKSYNVPIIGLLDPPAEHIVIDDEVNENIARVLEVTLSEFNIEAEVISVCRGPVVTMFEILPAAGVRLRRIVELSDNIALRLAAPSIRIVAPIPGKEAVGIEVPNNDREIVAFSELITDKDFLNKDYALPVVLGKNISNEIKIMDMARTPHLLIAGATGSGKSVCVNSIICSILYRCSPDEVKLILIDPKIVELSFYNSIGHLLTPVISDPAKSLQALHWCVEEMEKRYRELEMLNVREIRSYNQKIKDRGGHKSLKMPFILIIIDEFADLMMTCGKEIETLVSRLTAKSRAVGIHLVVATQRPSTDVITGLIKSNIPTRISFMVTSKTDSRIILDMNGAENLLGKGDMLFSSANDPYPERIQGPYLSEEEVEKVVEHIKDITGEPEYISDEMFGADKEDSLGIDGHNEDPLWDEAVSEVVRVKKASASHLQRRFKIGYNRAARLVEDMEDRGIIGPQQGSRPREVYAESMA